MGCTISGIQNLDTFCKRIKFLSEQHPHRELFTFYETGTRTVYTSRELFYLAGKFAALLRQQGFKRHDVIGNTLPNSPERIVTDVGVLLAGCIPMNVQLSRADGADVFENAQKSRCRGLVSNLRDPGPASTLFGPFLTQGEDDDAPVRTMTCESTPDLKVILNAFRDGERKTFLEKLRTSVLDCVFEAGEPDDVLAVSTTSGSTGFSKLVPYTHRKSLMFWDFLSESLVRQYPEAHEFTDSAHFNDRSLGWVVGSTIPTWAYGLKRVLFDEWNAGGRRASGKDILDIVTREKCRSAVYMAFHVYSILDHIKTEGIEPYRIDMAMVTGQPFRKKCCKDAFSLAKKIVTFYGSTEATVITAGVIEENQLSEIDDFYCGALLDGTTAKIIDTDGNPCPLGQTGTFLIKSPTIMDGYFNKRDKDDPKTKDAITVDGYLDMNDSGYLDHAGHLYVMGRNNDVIMNGALLVYPGWIEQQLLKHPKVQEAVVVPVPGGDICYEDICACILPTQGSGLSQKELEEFCDSMYLEKSQEAYNTKPKYFMILDKYPTTPIGKTDRKELKRMAVEMFGTKLEK